MGQKTIYFDDIMEEGHRDRVSAAHRACDTLGKGYSVVAYCCDTPGVSWVPVDEEDAAAMFAALEEEGLHPSYEYNPPQEGDDEDD